MWIHARFAHLAILPKPPAARRSRASSQPTVRPHGLVEQATIWLVYAAALYPLLLCFLNTRVARMPNAALVVAEVLIGLAAIPLVVARLRLGPLLLCLCLCLNFFVLSSMQQMADFKALRDLLMPVVFVWLGYALNDRRLSERVLRNLAIIAAVLGLVEFVFPTFFATLFDTIAFYMSRGFGANNPFQLTVLQTRPLGIGRSLFPFLGPRRMSSLFLEPVALGNFGVLIAAWALSKPRAELREAGWLMALALTLIVMADARFGSLTVLLMFMIRMTGLWRLRVLAALLPLLAMAALVLVAYFGPPEIHDNVVGRMQISGGNLASLPIESWLGVPTNISLDAGYGYIIQRTGLLICALLWFVFSAVPLKDDQARRFQFNVAVYASLNLCISGSSLFALKTTAILWLLLGTALAHRSMFDRSVAFGYRPVPAAHGIAA